MAVLRAMKLLLLVLCTSKTILLVGGQTMGDTDNLVTTLLSGYKKIVRPAMNQSHPVIVNMTLDLVAVLGFDEVKEELSIGAIVHASWVDPRLQWNPFLHAGITTVNIPQTEVWKPEIIIGNPSRSVDAIGENWQYVRYLYNGASVYSTGDVFYVTCAVDVTNYPFDIQKCAILFIPWGFLTNEVYLNPAIDKMLMTYFTENGEWMVRRTHAVTQVASFTAFTVEIELERRPTYFLVNVILPIMCMGFLNIMVFLLPAESGERISYAITVLLAIAVFLTLVSDNMPKTSEPTSILSYLLVSELILSALICLATIFNLHIFFKKDSKAVPPWLVGIVRKMSCSAQPQKTYVQDATDLQEATIREQGKNIQTIQLPREKMAWEETMATDEDPTKYHVTWRDVSRLLDKLFSIVCLLWLVGGILCYMIMVVNRSIPTVLRISTPPDNQT